jgi:hypothetical protein
MEMAALCVCIYYMGHLSIMISLQDLMITRIETAGSKSLCMVVRHLAVSWSLPSEPSFTNIVSRLSFLFHVSFYWMFPLPSLIILIGLYSSLKVIVDLLEI